MDSQTAVQQPLQSMEGVPPMPSSSMGYLPQQYWSPNGPMPGPPQPQRPPSGYAPNPMMNRINPQFQPRPCFVFSTEMLNAASMDIQNNRAPSLVHWHQQRHQNQQPMMPNMMDNGQRNSPNYQGNQPPSRALKRKNTSTSEQNPTPSPQMPGSVPEFKQPMSNQAPNSVPDFNNVKQEVRDTNGDESNPLKKMEIMAQFSDTPALKQVKSEAVPKVTKEEKLAKLDEIQRSLGGGNQSIQMFRMQPPPQQFAPGFSPGGPMPPGYINQAFPMQGYPPQQFHPNGVPQDPNMPSGPFPHQQGMHPGMPQNGFNQQMSSPRYMPNMQQGMLPMPGNPRPQFPPHGMDMGINRPPNAPDAFNWQGNMPQPLANLDSRVPGQKIQYYANGQGAMPNSMPPPTPNSMQSPPFMDMPVGNHPPNWS